jgi:hypothetical protein
VTPAKVSAAAVAAATVAAAMASSASSEGGCWDCGATDKDGGNGHDHRFSHH